MELLKQRIINAGVIYGNSFVKEASFMIASKAFEVGAESDEAKALHAKGLYTEEDLKHYAEGFAHFIQQQKRPEGILTGWYDWFRINRKIRINKKK